MFLSLLHSGKCYLSGEDALPDNAECEKEMDAALPKLGPDVKPADHSIWGTNKSISLRIKMPAGAF